MAGHDDTLPSSPPFAASSGFSFLKPYLLLLTFRDILIAHKTLRQRLRNIPYAEFHTSVFFLLHIIIIMIKIKNIYGM